MKINISSFNFLDYAAFTMCHENPQLSSRSASNNEATKSGRERKWRYFFLIPGVLRGEEGFTICPAS